MASYFCELCSVRGVRSRLTSYQINFDEAIWMCEVKECQFPVGYKQLPLQYIVQRRLSQISSSKKKKKQTRSEVQLVETPKCTAKEIAIEFFVQWQNRDALCWLDSILSVIVHNQTLRSILGQTNKLSQSLPRTLLEKYDLAQDQFATNQELAGRTLLEVQQLVWNYLEPKMKCTIGKNDSPVAALPLLLRESLITADYCMQEFKWKFHCLVCGYKNIKRFKKILVTFPNVSDDFCMPHGAFVRSCYQCGAPGQKTVMEYERMPDCIFVHFVEGLKSSTFLETTFSSEDGRLYNVTQFLRYSRNPDHFSCWTREDQGTRWLEMDDLKPVKCFWNADPPRVPPCEVHIVVWEKMRPHVRSEKDCLTISTKGSSEKSTTLMDISNYNRKLGAAVRTNDRIYDGSESTLETGDNVGVVNGNLSLQSFPTSVETAVAKEEGKVSLGHSTCIGQSSLTAETAERVSSHKRKATKFEPYVPRKQRLVAQSCPSLPLCSKLKQELPVEKVVEVCARPSLQSPLTSNLPPLLWPEVEEHHGGRAVRDDASDSGYSSNPGSVSSSVGQPNTEFHSSDAHTVGCGDGQRDEDLAAKLEELLPDCLLDEPTPKLPTPKLLTPKLPTPKLPTPKLPTPKPPTPKLPTPKPPGPVDLETTLSKLSDEQDQFLLNLLAA